MPLTEELRPKDFDEIIGNDAIISAIESVLEQDPKKVPVSWLFTGNSGCGKTTLAKIVSKKLGCADSAFYELNAALDEKGVNTVREIKRIAHLKPTVGNVKVFFMDECHMMTSAAQEGILKLLETPPKNTFFILCTTNPESLKETLKNRCASFRVSQVPPKKVRKYLKKICSELSIDIDDSHIKKIAEFCDGSLRVAVKTLDLVKGLSDDDAINAVIENSVTIESVELIDIAKTLLGTDDPKVKWKTVAPIIRKQGDKAESARLQLRGYLTSVLLNSGSQKHAHILECFVDNYYSAGLAGLALSCFNACKA